MVIHTFPNLITNLGTSVCLFLRTGRLDGMAEGSSKPFSSLLAWPTDPADSSAMRDEIASVMNAAAIKQPKRLDLSLKCTNSNDAAQTCTNYSQFSGALKHALKNLTSRKKEKEEGQPRFQVDRFGAFWQQLHKVDAATMFVAALLRRVYEMERDSVDNQDLVKRDTNRKALCRTWTVAMDHNKDGRIQRAGAPPDSRTFKFPPIQVGASYYIKSSMRAALLNTILIIALFYTTDVRDQEVQNILKMFGKRTWESKNKDDKTPRKKKAPQPQGPVGANFPGKKQVDDPQTWTSIVLQILQGSSLDGLSTAIPSMVAQCAAFMSSKVSATDNSLLSAGWVYLWLQQQLLNGYASEVQHSLAGTIQLIERDEHSTISPAHELQINCLFFMVRHFLSLHLADEDILKQWKDSIASFMDWPNPIGLHAIDTSEVLIREMKAPGFSLRKRWLKSDTRLLASHEHIRRGLPTPICVILNPNCKTSSNFQSLFDLTRQHTSTEKLEIKEMHQIMIMQILVASGIETTEELWKSLSSKLTMIMFQAILVIMREVALVNDIKEANILMKNRVTKVWNELVYKNSLIPIRGKIAKDQVPPSIDNFMNRSTPINFELIAGVDVICKPMNIEILELDNEPRPILATFAPSFPKTGWEEQLKNMITKDIAENEKKDVEILIAGGDGSLHHLLLCYIGLCYTMENHILIDKMDLCLYLLPTGDVNTLATYIAQRDLWYDTTLYRPLTDSIPFVPFVGDKTSSISKHSMFGRKSYQGEKHDDINPVVPKMLLTQQIENYFLEAHYKLKINIFNCEAWYKGGQASKTFYTTIPFFGRAELGLAAALAAGANHEELVNQAPGIPRRPVLSLSAQNLYNSDALDILKPVYSLGATITFYPIDHEGQDGAVQTIHGNYSAVLAVNVPRPSERRFGCDPSTDVLELCIMETETQSTRRCKVLDDITNWVHTYHTKQIVVQARNYTEPFHVLLDGEVYGPFYRVRLSALPHPTRRQDKLHFSVMTYWPTHASRTST